ncbi:hypothetical protein UlMin_037350 [Ulmus minor]
MELASLESLDLSANNSFGFVSRPGSFLCHSIQVSSSSRLNKGVILSQVNNQSWDLGRFLQTLYFFNGPPSPLKFFESLIGTLTGPSPSKPAKMETSGIVLVAGTTGGVGRRVVNILQSKGVHVRVLVFRNEEKAHKLLGPDIDLVVADITRESTLVPESFKGVRKIMNAISVIVGPKEGDTPDRAKYSQGIKFFEPEIKGDSPKKVEFIGMKILINLSWGALDDIVMGGVSESIFQIDRTSGENGQPIGIFKGFVSTANNGGFSSIRTKDLSAYDGLELCLKGDGHHAPPFEPTNFVSLQLMFSKFEYDGKLNPTFLEGPFQLPVSSIQEYLKDPISSRLELDLSKKPPAIHLNKELGSILTFKLKVEDFIRESGIPYAIVRPCALTEEPVGVDLIFDQGDNITGKMSREEVARICIAALESPYCIPCRRWRIGKRSLRGGTCIPCCTSYMKFQR